MKNQDEIKNVLEALEKATDKKLVKEASYSPAAMKNLVLSFKEQIREIRGKFLSNLDPSGEGLEPNLDQAVKYLQASLKSLNQFLQQQVNG